MKEIISQKSFDFLLLKIEEYLIKNYKHVNNITISCLENKFKLEHSSKFTRKFRLLEEKGILSFKIIAKMILLRRYIVNTNHLNEIIFEGEKIKL